MIVTQLCLDTDILKRYMSFLVSRQLVRRMNVIISIAVVQSVEIAERLRDNRRSAIIPDAMISRLKNSADPDSEGVDMCASLVQEIAQIPGVSGINFVAAGNLGAIAEVMAQSAHRSI